MIIPKMKYILKIILARLHIFHQEADHNIN